jgi:GNAT superfamily N-acetyltransferase
VIELRIRPGSSADAAAVVTLFDEAIEWLVGRGLVGQWGEAAFSARPEMRTRIERMLSDHEVRIAEHGGETVGAVVVGPAPHYVPQSELPELYVELLISARRLAGNAIGARLLAATVQLAHERGAKLVRVDCWADAPRLVRFYERQGFVRDGRFDLDGWRGQILSCSV